MKQLCESSEKVIKGAELEAKLILDFLSENGMENDLEILGCTKLYKTHPSRRQFLLKNDGLCFKCGAGHERSSRPYHPSKECRLPNSEHVHSCAIGMKLLHDDKSCPYKKQDSESLQYCVHSNQLVGPWILNRSLS